MDKAPGIRVAECPYRSGICDSIFETSVVYILVRLFSRKRGGKDNFREGMEVGYNWNGK